MTTTLLNAEVQLSRDIGDYWAGTTTSGGSSTTLIDTALMAFGAGWISKTAWTMITSGTYAEEERKVSSMAPATGTVTTLAHSGTIATAVTYRLHRICSASDKRVVLIQACQDAYPDIHEKVRDERERAGNWLRNGNPSVWTLTTVPDNWVVSALTCAENTTKPYYIRGSSSAQLDTAAGYLYQGVTQCPHFWELAGQTVRFEARGWCDTASALRLAIYDGTDTTYSTYHPGSSDWNDPRANNFYVEAFIPTTPTDIEFRVYLDSAAATAYVNDMRVTGPAYERIYVGHLSLSNNIPIAVYQQRDDMLYSEPWTLVRNGLEVDEDGWLYIPEAETGYRLRIEGVGYLDFLASGAASTSWSATVNINQPQLRILTAQAATQLYEQYIMPNMTTGTAESYMRGLNIMRRKLAERIATYGMDNMPAITDFGAR